MNGDWKDTADEVSEAFLDYYRMLLGSTHDHRAPVLKQIVQQGSVCQDHHKNILNAPYTADEVKNALFSIPGVKAPGPDGFGSYFYKDARHIVGDEVIAAILDMLQNGKLLKEVNHTVITLIPKTKCPKDVSEFRPISCCNTIYKCITKVLCGRLRQVLPDLIMENQGGFVHGRFIVHNIMVVQDLVKHYGRKGVKPSCLMKIDLQKAYDTVDWQFLEEMLTYLDFPCSFVKIVMQCVTTPMFSYVEWNKGDYQSILLLLQVFKLFSNSAGLKANQQKSSVYCHGMPEIEVQRVVDVSGFSRSSLPFKYLGVPICSKQITVAQRGHLVDKMITRIKIWSSRNLSYTARIQLINYIKWVTLVYLKDGEWWDYQPSSSASWYWRQICDTKEKFKQCFTLAELEGMAHYSVKQVYEKLLGVKPRVPWDRLVWNRLITPKHRFICWLAVQCRLQTTAKLARIGISQSALCLICGLQDENHNHLFFQCPFSCQIIQAVQNWLGVPMKGNLHQVGMQASGTTKFPLLVTLWAV
ncbi:uncharacterized protein [Spinacia oleracea]|uniref:Reverse transcriptase domain-containing protein n=1 Tax=Spinacia oleracea TaxID=3562 RepID=A0ABM3QQA8_SPIOL|nr:uncharacterized protein LOC130461464 [Spinacia oleracea]